MSETQEFASSPAPEAVAFQNRVAKWVLACFGDEESADELERQDRFLEEVFEALQARGYAEWRADAIKRYVFDREAGEIKQEIGGVMTTLAAWCRVLGFDMQKAGEAELARKPMTGPTPPHDGVAKTRVRDREHQVDVATYRACLTPLVARYTRAVKASAERDTFSKADDAGVMHTYDNGLTLDARKALATLAFVEACIFDILQLAKADGVESRELLEANAGTHELWIVGTREKVNGTTD